MFDFAKPLSTGFSAVGSLLGGFSQARQLRARARNVRSEGHARANDVAKDGRQALAAGNVVVGASGLTGEGSAEDVLTYLAQEVNADERRERHTANREAIQLENKARGSLFGGILGAATGGLSTIAGIGS